MKIASLFFLCIMLIFSYLPFAYSATATPNKSEKFSSNEIESKQQKLRIDLGGLAFSRSSADSFPDSQATYESKFRFVGDQHAYENSLSPRSQSANSDISDITFDNDFQNSNAEEWVCDEIDSDHNVKQNKDIKKRGNEWLKSKAALFSAINSSIDSLITELKKIDERSSGQIETSIYLIEGYKNVVDDAIALYEDFLNGTSGTPMNEDVLIEATKQLIDEMIFSIDHILSCIDEDDLKKYKILFACKENIKNWKYKLRTTSQIKSANGIKFSGISMKKSL